MFARETGARVTAIDLSPERLAMAETFGAEHLIGATGGDPIEAVHELTGGLAAPMTIDCSGEVQARAQAVRSTATRGTCCLVGEGGRLGLEVSPDLLRRQVTLLGSETFSSSGQAASARWSLSAASTSTGSSPTTSPSTGPTTPMRCSTSRRSAGVLRLRLSRVLSELPGRWFTWPPTPNSRVR